MEQVLIDDEDEAIEHKWSFLFFSIYRIVFYQFSSLLFVLHVNEQMNSNVYLMIQ